MPEPRLLLLPLDTSWRQALIDLEQQGQPYPWSAAQLRQALDDPLLYISGAIGSGGKLIGYAVLARLPFDAELQAITVAPQWRRQGIARALIEGLVSRARDWQSERLLLEVRAGNAGAIDLYRALGFKEDGRRPGYYMGMGNDREDAILMSRPLVLSMSDST
ncbi:ribosomal protein S18-alanine N-acetyltransferase [Pistricoccus aurantiacus]|uniref:Ribosomal-protein-alanine N-acetyltransferase n=1 Tax=Pistricoccus aurantiacus TaxID=1883414 RepID=A0A5B8SRZ0_9GAMM|nr:ribosomal protein S18-alanine N-acetyltransferase [Pistricoccus aurantiacus]QEA38747.1 ribosomal-protein-alanine N-acetyltransferase [Pistricoccus aurantiacus]